MILRFVIKYISINLKVSTKQKLMIFMISNRKLNRKLLAILILLSIFIFIPTTFASENIQFNQSQEISIDDLNPLTTDEINEKSDIIYVNASYESADGNGTIKNPVKTISESLNLVNDKGTVYLNGTFTGNGNLNLTLNGSPNEITFIGHNATIDGNYLYSFLIVNKGTYTFENITFANNYKTGDYELGGAIYNIDGKLTFKNCLFENNTVYGINRGNGGAIDNSGTLIVINCTFKNNSANVSNSSGFRKNAADGGALSNLGKMYVYDSIFENNKALRNGGAIRTQDHGTALIENCEFNQNQAAYHESGGSFGGAIYCWDCSLTVNNSIFKNNKVIDISGYGAQGGAISYDRSSDEMNIYSCQFINNSAEGVGLVSGQSLFVGGSANINYCTIDTSIYSASQDVNLNYNWWVVNDTSINKLIEMLPSSAKIKTYAELKVSFDVDEIKNGETIPIIIKLCWNGTENQDKIQLVPLRSIHLESNCGDLEDQSGSLSNGTFTTRLYLNSINNPQITANVDNVIVVVNLTKSDDNITRLSGVCSEIAEGEPAIIFISSNKNISGLCLIDIEEGKYYVELVDGKANVSISNLKSGEYSASIRYYNDNTINTTTSITVNKADLKDATITVSPKFTFLAVDYGAGERGGLLKASLKDTNDNALSDKTLQIALNGKIYNMTTNNKGQAELAINLEKANTYTCAISFKGSENCNAADLAITQVIITKKKTAISATAKTFKAKTKIKTVSVTLKTVKNPVNGKTYLKKGKKLTLTVNGKTYSAKTNAKGIAKFNIKLSKKGKYAAKIKFAGDSTYKTSGKTIKITIK